MSCFRNRSVCETHLIFYLILTVILCTSIVSYIYFKNKQLERKCVEDCPKSDNSSHNGVKDGNTDLNYQPLISDGKINSLVVKSRNSIELMRNTLNIPCILVGISINGTDLWTEGIGYSDLENGVKCHKHSAFSFGSMSKPMISLLIASLIDSKKVNLDHFMDDIDFDSYPIYNPYKSTNTSYRLSLRQLMSEMAVIQIENSSKTYNYCNKDLDFNEMPEEKQKFYESILSWSIVKDQIELIINKTFSIALNDFLFKNLNLISSGVQSVESIVPHRLRYYNKKEKGLLNYGPDDELPVNCGAVITTTPELMMIGREVIDIFHQKPNSTIKSSTFRQFISRQTQHPINQDIYYGLGWMLFDGDQNSTADSHFFGYNEQTSGSSDLFMVRPDNYFVISLFANLGGLQKELYKLAIDLINDFKPFLTKN